MNQELDGIVVLFIDGNNLLHRVAGGADPSAQRTLIPRMRSALPQTIATLMMLDGHADSGTSRRERVGRGFEIRHSGSMSADDALVRLITKYEPSERAGITVVTDDRGLAERSRHLGAGTQRLSWFEALIDPPTGKAAHIGTGPAAAKQALSDERREEQQEDRRPWVPGRGATRKRGNPKRRAR